MQVALTRCLSVGFVSKNNHTVSMVGCTAKRKSVHKCAQVCTLLGYALGYSWKWTGTM